MIILKTLIVFFITFGYLTIVNSQNVEPESVMEEIIKDYTKLRNPFLSQLPVEEIIKTPLEEPKKTIDNVPKVDLDKTKIPVIVEVKKEPIVFPDIQLQGIIFGVKDPQVIIDEKAYGVGEQVMGATVKSIGQKGVKFLFAGKEFHVDTDN